MAGWHHRLDGHELEQALGDSEGQGSLVCCSPWGCKESYMTEQLKSNSNRGYFQIKSKGIFHGGRCEITEDNPNNNSLCIQKGIASTCNYQRILRLYDTFQKS